MLEEEFKLLLKSYYGDKQVPRTTLEYAKDYPRGYSNASLSLKGIKLRRVLDELNNVPTQIELPKDLEGLIKLAKDWEKTSGRKIPTSQRVWARSSVRSGEIPFSTGYVEKQGVSVLDIIKALNPSVVRKTPEKVEFSDVLKGLNLRLISAEDLRVTYECLQCGRIDTTYRRTLVQSHKRGETGCLIYCNKSNRKKSVDYYQKFVPEEFIVLSVTNQVASIKHKLCGNLIQRGIRYLTRDSREDLVCEHCDPILVKQDGFNSHIEKKVITHLLDTFPNLEVVREPRYKDLIATERMFRGDLYYPKLNLVLEITHQDTNYENYLDNLTLKLRMLREVGILAYKVTSPKEAEDIVRSTLKDVEG